MTVPCAASRLPRHSSARIQFSSSCRTLPRDSSFTRRYGCQGCGAIIGLSGLGVGARTRTRRAATLTHVGPPPNAYRHRHRQTNCYTVHGATDSIRAHIHTHIIGDRAQHGTRAAVHGHGEHHHRRCAQGRRSPSVSRAHPRPLPRSGAYVCVSVSCLSVSVYGWMWVIRSRARDSRLPHACPCPRARGGCTLRHTHTYAHVRRLLR